MLASTVAALCAATQVNAGGFSLLEQTGSGIGYAYAGAAASPDDASVMFFNPAGLALLGGPQVAVALHGINLDTRFSDQGSTLPPAGLGLLPRGSTSDNAGDFIPLPNAYFAWPVSDRLAVGLGINTPFGLVTKYDDPWVGRFQGIRSELSTINVNPAIAFKLTDNIAIGVGANYQRADAELTNAVMLGAGVEGRADLDADDEAYGWNAGVIFTLPSATRIGVSYRSKMDYTLKGNTAVTTLAGTQIPTVSGPTNIDITFPDAAEISIAQPLGGGLELRADYMRMNWDKIGTVLAVNPATGVPRDVLNFGFEDASRAALGLNYQASERMSFRAGAAWDESPVRNELRTVRLPDSDRIWATLGARWQPSDDVVLDAGYAHLFVSNANVAIARQQLGAPAAFTSVVVGSYDSAVDIVSFQLTWKIQ